MPYLRKLPSGLWQATVRLPNGRRTTRTHPTKRAVTDWARTLEQQIAYGDLPAAGLSRLSFDDWRDRWIAARVVEPETAKRDRSVLANHVNRRWSGHPLKAISRLMVQQWVRDMSDSGVGAHATRHAYQLLKTMLNDAQLEGLIGSTPCRGISLPAAPPRQPEWFTREQVDAVVLELPERHAAAVQLMAWCGLRWGEMAGLQVQDVNLGRRTIRVERTLSQMGASKPYPKSRSSRREVPTPARVLDLLTPLMDGRQAEQLVFVTERQSRPWSGANWRVRWYEAIDAAQARRPDLGVPRYNPHALRHTAASWLVQQGCPIYDVQRLLGHESVQTTMRYAHLAPGVHDSVTQAWESITG